jgi:biopolymer transport protein ExbD
MANAIKNIAGDESVHHVSQRQKRGRGPTKMQPPLTPMIDVTFQLLLFFILTMQFRQAEGQIPADLPQEGQGTAETVTLEPVDIYVRAGLSDAMPSIEIGGVQVMIRDWEELHTQLVGLVQQSYETAVINPDADVSWNHVVNAYNQAVRAKFKSVNFAAAKR